jgi:ubiquinone/menaquinone biosynthesis C-methylase UbiE
MNYSQIIGIVHETNRPPGGLRNVIKVAQQAFVERGSRVLEIGTSTGFTAIELSRLTKCQVTAVDINEPSLEVARDRARRAGVAEQVTFELQDAQKLPYASNSFDLVFCGNVPSLIPDRKAALAEFVRVVRPGGFIAAIPMYYTKQPSEALVRQVSEAQGADLRPLNRQQWLEFYDSDQLVVQSMEDYTFDWISDATIKTFIDDLLTQPHLEALRADTREVITRKYHEYIPLFRENLSHMAYTMLMLRRDTCKIDAELFTSSPLTA